MAYSMELKVKKNEHDTSEGFIRGLINGMRPDLKKLGYELPENIRGHIGFPSQGKKAKAAVEVLFPEATGGWYEIITRCDQDDARLIAQAVAKAILHILTGPAHDGKFRDAALRIGFSVENGLRNVTPGPILAERLAAIAEQLGPVPYTKVDFEKLGKKGNSAGRPAPQKGRQRKAICTGVHQGQPCDYNILMTRLRAKDPGPPICPRPSHGQMVVQWHAGDEEAVQPQAEATIVDAEFVEVKDHPRLEAAE